MRRLRITAGVLVVMLLAASVAAAAETTREEYTERAEPICKRDTEANERILVGVRAEVRSGRLKPAAAQLTKASAALSKALGQLRALPQPKAEKARLATWLGYVKTEAELFATAARKLEAGERGGAEQMISKLTVNANRANATVLPFEFHYCRLEPAKFT